MLIFFLVPSFFIIRKSYWVCWTLRKPEVLSFFYFFLLLTDIPNRMINRRIWQHFKNIGQSWTIDFVFYTIKGIINIWRIFPFFYYFFLLDFTSGWIFGFSICVMRIFFFPFSVLQMNPSVIRQWLRGGEIDQLEQVILEGQGHKLIGEYSPDPKVRGFLKIVPNYMVSI